MVANWKNGHHSLTRIECHSENSKGVYCLQYDDRKIVSGLRDNTIKVSTSCNLCHQHSYMFVADQECTLPTAQSVVHYLIQ